jgi:hypothetical protein
VTATLSASATIWMLNQGPYTYIALTLERQTACWVRAGLHGVAHTAKHLKLHLRPHEHVADLSASSEHTLVCVKRIVVQQGTVTPCHPPGVLPCRSSRCRGPCTCTVRYLQQHSAAQPQTQSSKQLQQQRARSSHVAAVLLPSVANTCLARLLLAARSGTSLCPAPWGPGHLQPQRQQQRMQLQQ